MRGTLAKTLATSRNSSTVEPTTMYLTPLQWEPDPSIKGNYLPYSKRLTPLP